MKRDQHGPKAKEGNISWADVARLQAELQAHLGMRVCLMIETDEQTALDHTLRVRAAAFLWELGWHTEPKHQVISRWPNTMSSTVPGLMVRLMHQLDHVAWHQSQLREREGLDPLGA